jgi:hypothetical protein
MLPLRDGLGMGSGMGILGAMREADFLTQPVLSATFVENKLMPDTPQ